MGRLAVWVVRGVFVLAFLLMVGANVALYVGKPLHPVVHLDFLEDPQEHNMICQHFAVNAAYMVGEKKSKITGEDQNISVLHGRQEMLDSYYRPTFYTIAGKRMHHSDADAAGYLYDDEKDECHLSLFSRIEDGKFEIIFQATEPVGPMVDSLLKATTVGELSEVFERSHLTQAVRPWYDYEDLVKAKGYSDSVRKQAKVFARNLSDVYGDLDGEVFGARVATSYYQRLSRFYVQNVKAFFYDVKRGASLLFAMMLGGCIIVLTLEKRSQRFVEVWSLIWHLEYYKPSVKQEYRSKDLEDSGVERVTKPELMMPEKTIDDVIAQANNRVGKWLGSHIQVLANLQQITLEEAEALIAFASEHREYLLWAEEGRVSDETVDLLHMAYFAMDLERLKQIRSIYEQRGHELALIHEATPLGDYCLMRVRECINQGDLGEAAACIARVIRINKQAEAVGRFQSELQELRMQVSPEQQVEVDEHLDRLKGLKNARARDFRKTEHDLREFIERMREELMGNVG